MQNIAVKTQRSITIVADSTRRQCHQHEAEHDCNRDRWAGAYRVWCQDIPFRRCQKPSKKSEIPLNAHKSCADWQAAQDPKHNQFQVLDLVLGDQLWESATEIATIVWRVMRGQKRSISEFEQLACSKNVWRFDYEVAKHRLAKLVNKQQGTVQKPNRYQKAAERLHADRGKHKQPHDSVKQLSESIEMSFSCQSSPRTKDYTICCIIEAFVIPKVNSS